MKVKTAETAGFCFGVKRAVDRVYDLIEQGVGPIYTLGPIIHNEVVVNELAEKGVHAIEEKDLDGLDRGVVVLRSHGVGKEVYDRLDRQHLEYVDVTCPFVLKIHRIVKEESEKGNYVIIIGDRNHPEVQGICGWCQGPYSVINNYEEAERFVLPEGKKAVIVSQTTFNYNKFQELVEILTEKRYDNTVLNIFNILNTI
ncbi:MAG: 4-hydroxy-3-methylbut-2-enyl diphosphate reductase, partial [Eubacteriales bacterium]|nr:4-hydroxy-3-methylbut-2-enyl diphosphate reductase [Eubacteriales bacterium]